MTRSYDVAHAHQSREAEIDRLAVEASLGWDKEIRTLEWFGFRDGMSDGARRAAELMAPLI